MNELSLKDVKRTFPQGVTVVTAEGGMSRRMLNFG